MSKTLKNGGFFLMYCILQFCIKYEPRSLSSSTCLLQKDGGATSKKNLVHWKLAKSQGCVCARTCTHVCVRFLVCVCVVPWWTFTLMSLHMHYKLIESRYDKRFHITKARKFIQHLVMKALCVRMYFGIHGQIFQEPFLKENRNVFFCGHCFDDRKLCPFYGKL